MKIAILTETFLPQVNGVVRTVEKILKFLEKQNHEVILIAIGEGEDYYSNTKIVRIPGVPFTLYKELNIVKPDDDIQAALIENPVTQIPTAIMQAVNPSRHKLVFDTLDEFKPDLIHLVTPVTLGAVGHAYIEERNLPSLATFHTDITAYAPKYQIPFLDKILNNITKTIYAKSDKVLAPSPSSKAQLESIGLADVGVFGRGVDHTLFCPDKANYQVLRDYGLDPSKITLLYTGRLAEEKSIDLLVSEFKKLCQKHNNIQLLIVGRGPSRDSLETSLLGYPHAFTGLKTGEELAQLYASADIFSFPSITETFGQVVLEAMSSGIPVVGFDSPGVRDLVKEEYTGLLAKQDTSSDSVDGFYTKLDTLISDESLRKQMGKAAHKEAQKRSWDAILTEFVNEYSLVIKKHSKA